jgi:sulfofructose kinase
MRRLLPFVDYPIVPLGFAREYAPGAPREALLELHEKFGGTPVVTLGARGGLYLEGGRVRRFGAPRVPVRDTTGAGDAFHGAFAAAIARGLDLRAAIAWGARAGALCCTALGATGRLMTAAEAAGRGFPRAR